jgi:SAM-dependent methyltransferase
VTLPGEYFDGLYATNPDPWGFTTRWYEARKYALTLAALPRSRYRRAFEPGCSIGVLTAQLAERCDRLIASDPSEAALVAAKERVPANVELLLGSVPKTWPTGRFDLIVCSELGYYLSLEDLDEFSNRVQNSLEESGTFIAVHWRSKVPDYPQDGASVHRRLAGTFRRQAHYEDDFVLLDVFGGPASALVPPE